MANPSRTDLLRALPQVEEMLQLPEVSALLSLVPRNVLADCVREAVDELRAAVGIVKVTYLNMEGEE